MARSRIGNTLDLVELTEVVAAEPSAVNIIDVYRLATVAELVEGREWYPTAHALAVELDPSNPRRGAGVIAVLSPQLSWKWNVVRAREAYATGKGAGCLGKDKATRILAGEDADSVVGGKKVRAFFECIADPAAKTVCIDRHAFDIAVGRVTNDKSRNALTRKGVYESFAEAYVRAAEMLSAESGLDITPAEVQAITWTVWRRLKGLD